MDLIIDSPFNVDMRKHVYSAILQRASASLLAQMPRYLLYDEVWQVTHAAPCTKIQVHYRVLQAKNGAYKIMEQCFAHGLTNP